MPRIDRQDARYRDVTGDVLNFNIAQASAVYADLGTGYDVVRVRGDGVDQVRLTFTSAEVGNGNASDAGTLPNQDGGFAVRAQVEAGGDMLMGPVSRFDDEGITFIANGDFTFDVRDLVSGVERGDGFGVVQLGTAGDDSYTDTGGRDTYINAGVGNDLVIGGVGDDFLVGGGGNDELRGRRGDDSFIGGAGDDTIGGGNGRDSVYVDVATAGADQVNLHQGWDAVYVSSTAADKMIRMTFTSAEVGNGSAFDAGAMANQDGGLAVRLQGEDASGALTGAVGRYDDEGITFFTSGGVKFDVRDLVSGTERGDMFDIVVLGTGGDDRFNGRPQNIGVYANGGTGDDRMTGGSATDFLVGGLGDDVLNGWSGNDQLIGGTGADRFVFVGNAGEDIILDFVSGTDRIDMRSYDIRFEDVTVEEIDGSLRLSGNDNGDLFSITLAGVTEVAQGDFLF